jgi:hypothetical protein
MADEDDEWEENLEAIEALEGSGLELEEISWEELMKHNTVGDMWVSIVSVRPAWRCATLCSLPRLRQPYIPATTTAAASSPVTVPCAFH